MKERADSTRGAALVTGASGGIGEEIVRRLAARGHDVVLVARGAERLEALARELEAEHGVAAHVVPADLADPAAPEAVLRAVEARGVEVDVLVNNAGFGLQGPFAAGPRGGKPTDGAREMEMIAVNVDALTRLCKLFLPGMVERGRGRVLNVASTAAFQPGPLMAVYYATKAYVLSLSEALAVELEGTGVTVTALCPGATRTGFQAGAGMEDVPLFRDNPLVMEAGDVARIGLRGMRRGARTVVPGLANRIGVFATRLVPRGLAARVAMRTQTAAG